MTERAGALLLGVRRALVLALGPLLTSSARAEVGALPPWVSANDIPLPAALQSVEILDADEPLWLEPRPGSARRGAAELGAHLPVYAAVRRPGCSGRWLLVGPSAWLCEARVRGSSRPALAANSEAALGANGLPFSYFFVGPDGAFGYASLELAEEGVPDAELEPGFAVGLRTIVRRAGDPFGLTAHGYWLPLRSLHPAPSSTFRGLELEPGMRVGWVARAGARVFDEPAGRVLHGEQRAEREPVQVLETVEHARKRWFKIGPSRFMRAGDVRLAAEHPPPSGLRPGERWIDVDLATQTLTAYVGEQAVFTTLVSTGKGGGGHPEATPVGSHRVWVKLKSTDMDNLEDEQASRYYAMQSVPWVLFFQKGYGIHGTYWHDSFGARRSHGCVNLSPLDAQRIFAWTGPRLPAGWNVAFPTEYDPGTLIRVR